jgi:cytosine/adenosine deaminase-related metal-dependent hydrolase
MSSGKSGPCVVFAGPELEPWLCESLAWEDGVIVEIQRSEPIQANPGLPVFFPGMVNGHTHFGDCIIPDASTGLSLQEAFFRPNGLKYRRLAEIDESIHLERLTRTCREFARCGGVAHLDFREQGLVGVRRLRQASEAVGIRSVILGQFAQLPFDEAQLEANQDPLTSAAETELATYLEEADGFSESTMNDLTDAAWSRISEVTAGMSKLRAIHCLEDETYRDVSMARTGRGDLERAIDLLKPHLIVHMTVAEADDIARIAATGTIVALNPRANALLGLPLPPIAALMEAGVPLLLGTDNIMLNHPSLLAELDFAYRLARSQQRDPTWPDPREILKMVTVNAAPLVPGYTGQLEVGHPASWVRFDGQASGWRDSCHLAAGLLGRVGPDAIVETRHHGKILYAR